MLATIIRHFIGTPTAVSERIHSQLTNLHCPTLSDFEWYVQTFTSGIMMRDDSNQPFWKEKFINGLPQLFARKIRTILSNDSGHIDYDSLTYGDIVSIIKKEGLKMCTDMKIANQLRNDKRKT